MDNRIVIATSTELIRVSSDAVVYVTADGNYSIITLADGNNFVLTMQLGQIEQRISERLQGGDNRFIRIGKSLIVNRDFIAYICPAKQKLLLSNCTSFRYEVSASKEALKSLKELLESNSK